MLAEWGRDILIGHLFSMKEAFYLYSQKRKDD